MNLCALFPKNSPNINEGTKASIMITDICIHCSREDVSGHLLANPCPNVNFEGMFGTWFVSWSLWLLAVASSSVFFNLNRAFIRNILKLIITVLQCHCNRFSFLSADSRQNHGMSIPIAVDDAGLYVRFQSISGTHAVA